MNCLKSPLKKCMLIIKSTLKKCKKRFYISLVEVKATTGNTKTANTVLKNPQYDVDVCYKLSENNVGVVDNRITISYYMSMFLTFLQPEK